MEVRCIDLNPFADIGIDAQQARFIDVFLLLCLLAESPPDSVAESKRMLKNQIDVVEQGRRPGLELQSDSDQPIALTEWASQLLTACADIAELLDRAHGSEAYAQSVAAQRDKVADASQTPSALVLDAMRTQQLPFFKLTLAQAQVLRSRFLSQTLEPERRRAFEAMAAESVRRQHELEAAETKSFDEFLMDYLAIPQ